MIKAGLTSILILIIVKIGTGQYIPTVPFDSVLIRIMKIDSIEHHTSIDSVVADSIVSVTKKEIKEYADLIYLRDLWDQAKKGKDKAKRILAYKRIVIYPWYKLRDKDRVVLAMSLYEYALHQLIREYSGDVDGLYSLDRYIHPGYQSTIYTFLRREIIGAGGTWNLGEIPPSHIDPTRKPGK